MNTSNDSTHTAQPHTELLDWLHPSLHDGFIPLDPTTPLTAEQLHGLFAGDVQGVARDLMRMLQARQEGDHDDVA